MNRRHDLPSIVGPRAEKAEANEYPWHVGVVRTYGRNGGKPHCGGSIIAASYVLTAAHCTGITHVTGSKPRIGRTFSPHEILIVVGEHNIGDSRADRRAVSRILQHPRYRVKAPHLHYDFSIVTLARPVTFSHTMSPICLPASAQSQYTDEIATVSGWGRTSWQGPQPDTLLETTMRVGPYHWCSEHKHPSLICAYGHGSGVCKGDSGGQMSVSENGRLEVEIYDISIFQWAS